MQMRYDEKRGIYRDCKWCGGRGCLACPAEAEKEYKRQFPDGPKPIASFRGDEARLVDVCKQLLGPEAIAAAVSEADRRAAEKVSDSCVRQILSQLDVPLEDAKQALASDFLPQVIAENAVKLANNP